MNPRVLRKHAIGEHKFIYLFFFVIPYHKGGKTVSSDFSDGRQYSLAFCLFYLLNNYVRTSGIIWFHFGVLIHRSMKSCVVRIAQVRWLLSINFSLMISKRRTVKSRKCSFEPSRHLPIQQPPMAIKRRNVGRITS